MSFDLCMGNGGVFWEFKDAEERDRHWMVLIQSYGWEVEWAERQGDKTSARSVIVFHLDKMPSVYRWRDVKLVGSEQSVNGE